MSTTRLLISDGMDSIATRSFCNECGSTLNMQYDCYKGDRVHIAAGSMTEGLVGSEVQRSRIWVKDKPEWYKLPSEEEGVQVWDGFDDSFTAVLRKFEEGERKTGTEPVTELPGGYESLDEESGDEVLIRRAVERAKDVIGESDEELQELRRRYGGGSSGRRKEDVEVEEYMYHSGSD